MCACLLETMVILQDMSPKSPSVDKLVSDALMGSLKTLMQTTPDVSGHRLEYTVVNKSEVCERSLLTVCFVFSLID